MNDCEYLVGKTRLGVWPISCDGAADPEQLPRRAPFLDRANTSAAGGGAGGTRSQLLPTYHRVVIRGSQPDDDSVTAKSPEGTAPGAFVRLRLQFGRQSGNDSSRQMDSSLWHGICFKGRKALSLEP